MVFKIYGERFGFELGGGGRYDGLLAKFGWDLPAVGFSLTLDRILPLVGDLGTVEAPSHDLDEYVVAVEGSTPRVLFEQVWNLRRQGMRVRVGRRA
jgi:ATP phosphoribosyltransferase regulatory subunit